jgi:hypothetical protein
MVGMDSELRRMIARTKTTSTAAPMPAAIFGENLVSSRKIGFETDFPFESFNVSDSGAWITT